MVRKNPKYKWQDRKKHFAQRGLAKKLYLELLRSIEIGGRISAKPVRTVGIKSFIVKRGGTPRMATCCEREGGYDHPRLNLLIIDDLEKEGS